MSERERLRAKSRRLRSEMRRLGPMIKGSVIFREMRCGKPICKCTRCFLFYSTRAERWE